MVVKRKHDDSVKLEPGASQLANHDLLDKIDKLFALNVGAQVPLPQLVVVGDQSSGKSSVLEGLTNLPFPRDKVIHRSSAACKAN